MAEFLNIDWNKIKNIDLGSVFSGDNIATGVNISNGLTGIIGSAQRAASINENPSFNYGLNALQQAGTWDYNNFDQIAQGMNNVNTGIRQDYNTVRGMTNGQKWGTVGSAALSGAVAGSKFGWLGSAIGGVVGGAAGLFGVKRGDRNAEAQTNYDNSMADIARQGFLDTAQAEHEDIVDFNHRNRIYNLNKYGGQVVRKQMDINEFASRVLNKPKSRVVRTKCKGGVMIKINR